MNAKSYFGWYSAKAAELYGTKIYRRADGVEFEITTASTDPNYKYGFKDAVFLGEVGDYARNGRDGNELLKTPEPTKFDLLVDPEQVTKNMTFNAPAFVALMADMKKRIKGEEDVAPTVVEVRDGETVIVEGRK